jgi:hypothetical protein
MLNCLISSSIALAISSISMAMFLCLVSGDTRSNRLLLLILAWRRRCRAIIIIITVLPSDPATSSGTLEDEANIPLLYAIISITIALLTSTGHSLAFIAMAIATAVVNQGCRCRHWAAAAASSAAEAAEAAVDLCPGHRLLGIKLTKLYIPKAPIGRWDKPFDQQQLVLPVLGGHLIPRQRRRMRFTTTTLTPTAVTHATALGSWST